MDKKALLMETVQKLLALKVPDNEIILNLAEIGITTTHAKELLSEAKGQPVQKKEKVEKEVEKDSGEAMMAVAEKLAETRQTTMKKKIESGDLDEFLKAFPEEEKEIQPVIDIRETVHADNTIKGKEYKNNKSSIRKKTKQKIRLSGDPVIIDKIVKSKLNQFRKADTGATQIGSLWEKGILTAINQKLNEMKSIKTDLDKDIQSKINQAMKDELEKVRVSFESQRVLMVSQMEEQLEKKFKEATYFIDQKLIEIKTSKNQLEEVQKIINDERKKQKHLSEDYEEKMGELKTVKDNMISELNSDLIKAKSNIHTVLEDSELKLKEIDERVNKTLELESSIAEGLVGDAETKISGMVDDNSERVRQEADKAVVEVKKIRTEMEQQLKKKMDDIELESELKSLKMLEKEAKKMQHFSDSFEKQLTDKLIKLDRLYRLMEKEASR